MKYFLSVVGFISFLGLISNDLLGSQRLRAFPLSEERDIYKNLEEEEGFDSALPASPMQLMQLLQKSTSMDNATSPSDAIDEALKAFNEEPNGNFSFKD